MQHNPGFINNTLKKTMLLLMVFAISACSAGDSTSPVGVGNGLNGGDNNGETTVDIGTITVAANPTTVTVNGTSSVTVVVQDTSGNDVPDGTLISFALSDSSLGSIGSVATTYNGTATAAFTAATKAGTVSVTATAGGVTSSPVNITVNGADAGSIAFESADPPVVGIKGTGQNEVSIIKFTVLDINGNPVLDGTAVNVSMSGPEGGEYINEDDSTPLDATVSTVGGEATVFLHSGLVAGNVTFFATVDGTGLTSATPTLSIGGGVPDYAHLTIAADTLNLEGLEYVNIQSNISVYVADRFGNLNVLEGTTVSFYTESGALKSSAMLDVEGKTQLTFRTQNPIPYDVAPLEWEMSLFANVASDYNIPVPCIPPDPQTDPPTCIPSDPMPEYPAGNPRDGLATVTVGVIGEEDFDDANGNGVFDGSDTYTDTLDELFLDANDNGIFNDGVGAGVDPLELYVDDNGSGVWDGANDQWDASKTIFKSIRLLITGRPTFIAVDDPDPFTILDAGSKTFRLLVSDINLNPLIAGSTVNVTLKGDGELTGTTDVTFTDTNALGPLEISFTLSDKTSGDTDLPKNATIKVVVTWKGVESLPLIISGTID